MHLRRFSLNQTQCLNHAIRQIQDWRSWLLANQGYAAGQRTENGLGLADINGNVLGLVLIGRRSSLHEGTAQRRRQMVHEIIGWHPGNSNHRRGWLVSKLRLGYEVFEAPASLNTTS